MQTYIIPLLYHWPGNSPKKDYVMTMKYLEAEGLTQRSDGYDPNWRSNAKKIFDVMGNYRDGDGITSVRQGLLELKHFKGVKKVDAGFKCPHCGYVDEVTWDLHRVETENMLNACPVCKQKYDLTLRNTSISRWYK